MKCEEVMIHEVPWCVTSEWVQVAAETMRALDADVILVCEPLRGGCLVGILTDRDIVFRLVAAGLNPAETPVGTVMSREPIVCNSEDDLEVALDAMTRHQLRRIPTVDRNGQLLGIVTLTDAVLWSGEPTKVIERLREAATALRASLSVEVKES